MTTKTAANPVVHLESHPAWRASRRRARELDEAMRRHPSYQSRTELPPVRLHSV
ncbi:MULTISPECIES: hypothetical protein [Mycobacteriaceae]|uniref:Uncharacterized protein n=1 Tax=Mycolicibacterium parafortuitum TaxID=39692 RepID=A0ACC6MF64_MYCPF|nr:MULTISPECIES: hypothetical protein [Mycobacteriaceae]MBX7446759.1 hypothetical protein [Mycolicibacterium aurantiacum]MDZ5085542.1 hypothetical protein [Mycolicibacterium parafortuitum]